MPMVPPKGGCHMASIEKRGNSYRIKVSCGYKTNGTQVVQRMTWTPDPDMTPKQIEKRIAEASGIIRGRV